MPRYNGAQLARAAAFGQELLASTSFVDDGEWHAYQLRVQVALRPEKPLPAVRDPRRRIEWGSLVKAHKKMIAQLQEMRGQPPTLDIAGDSMQSINLCYEAARDLDKRKGSLSLFNHLERPTVRLGVAFEHIDAVFGLEGFRVDILKFRECFSGEFLEKPTASMLWWHTNGGSPRIDSPKLNRSSF